MTVKSLILETSTESALLAVVDGEQLLFEKHLLGGPQLSKTLGLEIKQILTEIPLPFNRVIFGNGPGSFTGIRVGAAMAQALAFGWKIPLFTASSLSGFAPENEKNFAIAIDARSGGFFIQENFSAPKLLNIAEAEQILLRYPIVASPHPEKILARVPSLHRVVQTKPNPFIYAQQAIPATEIALSYLSHPDRNK